MSESELRSLTRDLYDELVSEHARAVTSFGRWSWLIPQSAESGLQTLLTRAETEIATLAPEGSATVKLLSGEWSWEKWRERAMQARKDIAWVLAELPVAAYTPSRLWDEVIAPTAATVASKAEAAVQGAATLTPWLAAAAVALAVGYLVFSFRGLRPGGGS